MPKRVDHREYVPDPQPVNTVNNSSTMATGFAPTVTVRNPIAGSPAGSDQGGHGEVVRHQDPPHPFAIRQLRTDPLSLETQRVGALLHLKVFRPQRLRSEWGLAVLTPSTRFAVLTGHATSLRVLSCRKQLRNLLVRAIFIAVGQEFESP